MVAGVVLAVMLTTGRSAGAGQEVLESLDAAGSRSIAIRAEAGAGIGADVLDRVANIQGVAWAGAFSPAVDSVNASVRDGIRVPLRAVYSDNLEALGIPIPSSLPGELAYASTRALDDLGLPDIAGAVTVPRSGESFAVAGQLEVPDFLAPYEPLLLVPGAGASGEDPVGLILVTAAHPDLVVPVSEAVLSVLGADDPSAVTVQTSEAVAQLRSIIQGQLGGSSHSLILAILALTATLLAILLHALVLMRRRDFGRRRALGATRGLIVGLVIAQTGMLAVAGIFLGWSVSVVVLGIGGDPLPGAPFTAAIGILALGTALAASVGPAIAASRRDPIRELRVP